MIDLVIYFSHIQVQMNRWQANCGHITNHVWSKSAWCHFPKMLLTFLYLYKRTWPWWRSLSALYILGADCQEHLPLVESPVANWSWVKSKTKSSWDDPWGTTLVPVLWMGPAGDPLVVRPIPMERSCAQPKAGTLVCPLVGSPSAGGTAGVQNSLHGWWAKVGAHLGARRGFVSVPPCFQAVCDVWFS